MEDRAWGAAAQSIPAMGPFVIVEAQVLLQPALQLTLLRKIRSPKDDAPMLRENRALQALDEAIGPGVSRLGASLLDREGPTGPGKDPLPLGPVVGQDG